MLLVLSLSKDEAASVCFDKLSMRSFYSPTVTRRFLSRPALSTWVRNT